MKFKVKSVKLMVVLVMIVVVALFAGEINAKSKTYKIGDKGPAGGWIFYDKGNSSDGWRYLEAAPDDLADKAEWGCSGKSILGAKGTEIGTGKSNTQAIIKSCSKVNIAAKRCTEYRGGGKRDWFLPSKDELDLMYNNLQLLGQNAHFYYEYYWSSSDSTINAAWHQEYGYSGGYKSLGYKRYPNSVRAIRAFDGLSVQTVSKEEVNASNKTDRSGLGVAVVQVLAPYVGLNMRYRPSMDGEPKLIIPNGSTVKIIERGEANIIPNRPPNWYYVEWNGSRGWVLGKYLGQWQLH